MHTEHLHQTLSPQAHAALLDALRHRAEQERRQAVGRFGQRWLAGVRTLARQLASQRTQTAPTDRLLEG